jgi:ABC-type branched-subunit amino acid transport system substrate-binding protein
LIAVALLSAMLVAPAGGTPSVRGFDGTTVKVAGIGIAAQFAGADTGSRARIERFNKDNEIKGVKLQYVEFADDKQDQATALSETRRLVTQEQVFALVGDLSQFNPGDYLAQQHVPYFGFAFDKSYCSKKVDTSIWGFGYNGCLVNPDPSVIPDSGANEYTYASQKTGKKHPTAAVFGNDTDVSKSAVHFNSIGLSKAGFDVVATQNQMGTTVSDYTPYVQAVLTADNGKAPDAAVCLLATDCIQMNVQLQANGYKGILYSSLYSDLITKLMANSVATTLYVPPTENTPGMNQLKKDVDAVKPGTSSELDTGIIASYASTDMFIQALKTAAKKGKSGITPENVQKAAMNQTWQLEGVAGPTIYPTATMASYASCNALVLSDGTAWKQVVPFTCSKKLYPVK